MTPRRMLAWTAAVVVAIKAIQLVVDAQPLYFFDSFAYLYNAVGDGFLSERSWLYSLVLRALVIWTESTTPLMVVQSAVGAGTAWLIAFLLVRHFEVDGRLAILAAVVFALDPTQVVHERLVMTEAMTLFAVAVYVTAAIAYVRTPRAGTLAGLAALAVVPVALRLVYVPVVWASALLLPIAAHLVHAPRRWRACAVALGVSLASTFAAQQAYQYATGLYAGREPAYHYRTGAFLSAAVAPILEPQDADDPVVGAVIAAQNAGTLPLGDISRRAAHLWSPEGYVARVITSMPDEVTADAAMQRAAANAIRRDPVGVARLAVWTYALYWVQLRHVRSSVSYEHGESETPMVLGGFDVVLRDRIGLDVAEVHRRTTWSARYHTAAAGWVVVQLLAPFLCLLAVVRVPPSMRAPGLVVAVWPWLTLAATCVGSPESPYRYLHPISFTGLVGFAVLAQWSRTYRR